jgi:molybdopterin-binding protein
MGLPADAWTAAFFGMEEPQRGVVAASGGGLVEIACGEVRVAVTGEAPVGSAVAFAVRPEDIILFEDGSQLPLSTARNQLIATVVSVSARGATNHIVLDAGGMKLAASVSRSSATDLALAPGRLVLAVFKATAVRWDTSAKQPKQQSEDVSA